MSLTKLATFYIAWLGVGSVLAGIGWYFLGHVVSEKRQRALRALLVAGIFGFSFIGSDSTAVLVPAWAGMMRMKDWPAALCLIAIWWGIVYFAMYLVGCISAKLLGGGSGA